jgi:hypothetical protein
MKKRSLAKLLSLSTVFVLAACTTPAIVKQADPSVATAAKNFRGEPDRAKVYFVNGKIVGNIFGMSHRYPKDIFVNGRLIGSMNPENVMVTDLSPGEYRFAWNVRSTDIIDKKTESQDALVRVGAGDVVVMVSEYDMGGAAMFGLLGSLMSPPKAQFRRGTPADVPADKTVVAPQSCPQDICLANK